MFKRKHLITSGREHGASLVEMAILVSIVAAVTAGAVRELGNKVSSRLADTANAFDSAPEDHCDTPDACGMGGDGM